MVVPHLRGNCRWRPDGRNLFSDSSSSFCEGMSFLRSVVSPAASVYVGSSGQGQLKDIAPLLGQQWLG